MRESFLRACKLAGQRAWKQIVVLRRGVRASVHRLELTRLLDFSHVDVQRQSLKGRALEACSATKLHYLCTLAPKICRRLKRCRFAPFVARLIIGHVPALFLRLMKTLTRLEPHVRA